MVWHDGVPFTLCTCCHGAPLDSPSTHPAARLCCHCRHCLPACRLPGPAAHPNTTTTSVVGFAMFYVCLVGGQLVSSMVVDHVGLLGVSRRPAKGLSLLGAAVTFGGAVVAVAQRLAALEGGGWGPQF